MTFNGAFLPPTRVVARDETQKCVSATPGVNGNVPVGACNSYYNYDPKFEPAVAVAVIWGMITGAHVLMASLYRKKYSWVVIMGCVWETAAFILHCLGSKDQQEMIYAIGWQLLFLLAPLWVNAYIYMTFARMVYYYLPGPEKKIRGITATHIAKYFIGADILTFIIQAAGGAMASPGSDAKVIKTGLDVYLAGMALQQFFMLIFAYLMVEFQLRLRSWGPGGDGEHGSNKRRWRPLQYSLYVVLAFITIRNAFRMAEFAPGLDESNTLLYHEEYVYGLDCGPMMIALTILAVFHPGRFLVGPDSEFPRMSRREKKAARQARKDAKRVERQWAETYQKQSETGSSSGGSARETYRL